MRTAPPPVEHRERGLRLPGPDPGPTTTDTEPTAVADSADLSITKTDSADPVIAGEDLTYTLVVTNDGPSDATNVVVTDDVPAGTSFVSADGGGLEAAGTVTWNLGTLADGATRHRARDGARGRGPHGDLSNTASRGLGHLRPRRLGRRGHRGNHRGRVRRPDPGQDRRRGRRRRRWLHDLHDHPHQRRALGGARRCDRDRHGACGHDRQRVRGRLRDLGRGARLHDLGPARPGWRRSRGSSRST